MFAAVAVIVLLATVWLADAQCSDPETKLSCQECETNDCVWCAGMIRLYTSLDADVAATSTLHDVKMGACVDTGGDCTTVTFGSLAAAWDFTDTELGKLGSSAFEVAARADFETQPSCGDHNIPLHAHALQRADCTDCLALNTGGVTNVRWCQTTGTVTDIGTHEGGVCVNQDLADAGYCIAETELTEGDFDTTFPLRMFVRSEVFSDSTSCTTTAPPTLASCDLYGDCFSCGKDAGCEWCYGVATVTKTGDAGDVIGDLPLAFGKCIATGGTCDTQFTSVNTFFTEYYASANPGYPAGPADPVTSVTVAMKTGGEAAWCAEQDSLMDPTLVNSDCHSCQSSETAPGTWCSLSAGSSPVVTAGGMCQTACTDAEFLNFLNWSQEVLGHEIEVAEVTTCPSTTTTTTTEATTSGAGRAGLLVGCPLAFAAIASLHAI